MCLDTCNIILRISHILFFLNGLQNQRLTDLRSLISSTAVSVQCSALFTTFIATNLFTLQPQRRQHLLTGSTGCRTNIARSSTAKFNRRSPKHESGDRKERKVVVILDVPGEPHGGEVTPAQFPDHVVFPIVEITNFHVVVATYNRRSMQIRQITHLCSS